MDRQREREDGLREREDGQTDCWSMKTLRSVNLQSDQNMIRQ